MDQERNKKLANLKATQRAADTLTRSRFAMIAADVAQKREEAGLPPLEDETTDAEEKTAKNGDK